MIKFSFLFLNFLIYLLIYYIGHNIFVFINTNQYNFGFLFGFLALFLSDVITIDIFNSLIGGDNEEKEEGNDR